MNHQTLIKAGEMRPFSLPELNLPSLPPDAKRLLEGYVRHHSVKTAAWIARDHFSETLELTSYPHASGPWYSDRDIRILLWPGDLTIDGDLIDDDFNVFPLLIVRGHLTVRNWLRGGMAAFIGGSVRASGFIIGHYNDSALFVGGDLTAAGYIPRAKPYRDLPDVVPHQIAGELHARRFDNTGPSKAELQAAFVEEALITEDEDLYLDERAIMERASQGLPVWR